METFIFYNHTHGREMLDVYVHKLLVLAAFLTGLVAFMEIIARTNIAVELLRTSFVLLQGSWFWQIGFVLYPPVEVLHGIQWIMTTLCFSAYAFVGIMY